MKPHFLFLIFYFLFTAATAFAQLTDVAPMIKSHWSQSSPYNDQAPVAQGYYGYHCQSGCVATAMAQVLHYYQLPKQCSGWKVYTFSGEGGQRTRLSEDYNLYAPDWKNILNDYSASTTAEQKKAVAELLYACGVGANTIYKMNASSANMWTAADALNTFFPGIRAELRDFDVKVVAEELRAGRPVIYAGSGTIGAHCFVIDGSTADGMLHCNLGRGGEYDDYYSPKVMAGYPNSQQIIIVHPTDELTTYTPMEELRGKIISTIPYEEGKSEPQAVNEIQPNTWYILYNNGRAGSPYSRGKGKELLNTHHLPMGESSIYCAAQLMRFVPNSKGTAYYIQTGLGDYWAGFNSDGNAKTSSVKSSAYTVGQVAEGCFWLKNSNYMVDTNGPGATVVAWGTEPPTDRFSNSSWRVYPVEIADDPSYIEGITPGIPANPGSPSTHPLDGEAASPVYDLQGVRVGGTTGGIGSGIYISNRKKIIR